VRSTIVASCDVSALVIAPGAEPGLDAGQSRGSKTQNAKAAQVALHGPKRSLIGGVAYFLLPSALNCAM
jgi:hypothetical protein